MTFGKEVIISLLVFLFIGCGNVENNMIGKENKYKTEIKVHYSANERTIYTFYTNKRVDVCSFNGTNYLIEKDNQEELMSTTAPIEIIKQSKFDTNGTETEIETIYYRGSN